MLKGVSATFDCNSESTCDYFKGLYQRNNKNGGQKHLRCFPRCNETHNPHGFCGSSVVTKVVTPPPSLFTECDMGGGTFFAFGTFRSVDDTNEPGVITMAKMQTNANTGDNPLNPWYIGNVVRKRDRMIEFEFNSERRGWHYGWFATRTTRKMFHNFKVYIYYSSNPDPERHENLHLVATCTSSPFQLICTKRVKSDRSISSVDNESISSDISFSPTSYGSERSEMLDSSFMTGSYTSSSLPTSDYTTSLVDYRDDRIKSEIIGKRRKSCAKSAVGGSPHVLPASAPNTSYLSQWASVPLIDSGMSKEPALKRLKGRANITEVGSYDPLSRLMDSLWEDPLHDPLPLQIPVAVGTSGSRVKAEPRSVIPEHRASFDIDLDCLNDSFNPFNEKSELSSAVLQDDMFMLEII